MTPGPPAHESVADKRFRLGYHPSPCRFPGCPNGRWCPLHRNHCRFPGCADVEAARGTKRCRLHRNVGRKCRRSGCEGRVLALRLCQKHYKRLWRKKRARVAVTP